MPVAPTAAADATPAHNPITMAAVAVRQRLDVQALHAKALEQLETLSGKKIEPKHVAMFFENVARKDGSAQQQKGDCMCCGVPVSSTGAFKFHTHILSCALMPAQVKKPFKELREKTESNRQGKREVALVQSEEAQIAAQQHAAQQARLKQQCIRAGVHSAEVDAADKAIANFFYANALPFSAASSDQASLYRQMVKAIQKAPSNYVHLTTKSSEMSC